MLNLKPNMMEPQKKPKSRNLSVYEFFKILQLEWIVADLRVRIYPKKKDKEYWVKVKEGKRVIIESIAEKNHLPTIFSDDEMKRAFEALVYLAEGVPNFVYKDDINRNAQEPFDLLYYFHKGAEVRFDWYSEIKVGKVKSYVAFSDTVTIEFDNQEAPLPISKVTRIL